jgi:hypothetical protein
MLMTVRAKVGSRIVGAATSSIPLSDRSVITSR